MDNRSVLPFSIDTNMNQVGQGRDVTRTGSQDQDESEFSDVYSQSVDEQHQQADKTDTGSGTAQQQTQDNNNAAKTSAHQEQTQEGQLTDATHTQELQKTLLAMQEGLEKQAASITHLTANEAELRTKQAMTNVIAVNMDLQTSKVAINNNDLLQAQLKQNRLNLKETNRLTDPLNADKNNKEAMLSQPRYAESDLRATLEKLKMSKFDPDAKVTDMASKHTATQFKTDIQANLTSYGLAGQQTKTEFTLQTPHQITSVQVPVNDNSWASSVFDRVMWLSQQNNKTAQIQINPPELGPLEVRVRINNDQANVTFMSQHGSVRDTLENALPRLRELFAGQGIDLGDVNVSDQSLAQEHATEEQEQNLNYTEVEDERSDEMQIDSEALLDAIETGLVLQEGRVGIDSYA